MTPAAARQPAPLAPNVAQDARRSHGLQALVAQFAAATGLYVLDLGGPIQANINFVTSAGHRLYIDDLLQAYEYFFSAKEQSEHDFRSGRIEEFIDSVLDFPNQSADIVFVWDRLQFLPTQVAEALVARLHRILSAEGAMLGLFRTESGLTERPPYSAHILDGQTLLLQERQRKRALESFTPRTIQKLFQEYREVRFFVGRESLQEVLIRR
jgi:hypothetical protein